MMGTLGTMGTRDYVKDDLLQFLPIFELYCLSHVVEYSAAFSLNPVGIHSAAQFSNLGGRRTDWSSVALSLSLSLSLVVCSLWLFLVSGRKKASLSLSPLSSTVYYSFVGS